MEIQGSNIRFKVEFVTIINVNIFYRGWHFASELSIHDRVCRIQYRVRDVVTYRDERIGNCTDRLHIHIQSSVQMHIPLQIHLCTVLVVAFAARH